MNRRPPYRITAPVDLLALVPCVLGFHPEQSLVLVVTAGDGAPLHARLDLPRDDEEKSQAVQLLLSAASKAEARQVALVAYADVEEAVRDVVDALALELEDHGVDLLCALRADGERWYSLDCGPLCCPTEGETYDLESHPITAQAVLDGKVTYLSRRALADSLVGTDLEAVESVGTAADEAMRRFGVANRSPLGPAADGSRAHRMAEGLWARDRVRRYVRTGEPLDHDEVGRMVVAMLDIEVRDVAWAEMTRADARLHVELWRDVVRRTPLDLLAAPAALLAFAAWLAGEGALAWCAVERCQEADPGYSLATLVAQALEGARHPSVWSPVPPEDLPLFAG
jgi:hypothetical protein